jgi:hypothetical protein
MTSYTSRRAGESLWVETWFQDASSYRPRAVRAPIGVEAWGRCANRFTP